MVLILLLLLCNHNSLILKLHQKKVGVGSVPGIINKEVLAQFIHKPA